MGGLTIQQGDIAGAEPILREALALQKRLLGPEHPEIANAMVLLSRVIKQKGDPAGGETMCKEAIAMHQKFLGAEHVQIASALDVLSGFARDRGALEEAEMTPCDHGPGFHTDRRSAHHEAGGSRATVAPEPRGSG